MGEQYTQVRPYDPIMDTSENRYKLALFGGNLLIENGDDWGPMRCSTAAEAQEAWRTMEEVASVGTPWVSLSDLEEFHSVTSQYLTFYRALQPGEEVFYNWF